MSVGIDVGSKTVKIVELHSKRDGWKLKASGVIGYKGKSPDVAANDNELAPLVQAVRKLYKEAKVSSRDVAVSIPEQHVFTRSIKFPLLSDAEVASAVKWEAEQYIPIPIEDAIVQHQVIGRMEEATPPQVLVLLIAVPRTIVEKYAKAMGTLRLKPVVVESEMMSAARSLASKQNTVVIVDMGAKSTNIAVTKNGVLTFSRSVHISGEAFTRAISQFMGISDVQAEEYKRTYGLNETQLEGKISKALENTFLSVAEEIKKAIHFYKAEGGGDSPQSVILSGGSSLMPNLVPKLTEILGIEVVIGNPFSKVEVDPKAVKTLTGFAPLYSVAVGLAMRSV